MKDIFEHLDTELTLIVPLLAAGCTAGADYMTIQRCKEKALLLVKYVERLEMKVNNQTPRKSP